MCMTFVPKNNNCVINTALSLFKFDDIDLQYVSKIEI